MNDFAFMDMTADLRQRERFAAAQRERQAQEAIRAALPVRRGGLLASAMLFVRIVRLLNRQNRQRAHHAMMNRAA